MQEPVLNREPEELLRHSAWVHALARSLVTDTSLADDVAQETWLAALDRRSDETPKSRSWFAAVARNVVRGHCRSENRRSKREELYAPGEALASTEEVVQVEAERRKVVDLVLGLTEPSRRTILLRFWSDLSLEEIANN